MMTDARGRIEYVNPAFEKITGYKQEEALGRDPSLLKSEAQDPSFYKELWDTIHQGEVWNGTLIDRKKDGSYFPAMMSVAPIRDETGGVAHYVSLLKDMTEHQRLEDQLRHVQKMESIGTLVGGIAHDFNNMLAAIDGNLFLASTELDQRSELEGRLQSIQTLSYRAADIVRQLLTYARKDIVSMEDISLNTFMGDSYALTQATIPENIVYTYDECHEELMVHADATQLQQLLMNLLNNARHAVSAVSSPRINCSVERVRLNDAFLHHHTQMKSRDAVRISIADNGYGISSDNTEKIFEPFFTTKPVGEGTGLGLSMVYGSIQRHGGAIEVESQPGAGTSFHIYLPLIEKAEQSQRLTPTAANTGEQEWILLVDDQQELLQTTSQVLRSLNYQVIEASDGEEALACFEHSTHVISLVLTDVVMPKLGGFELMEVIWQSEPEMPTLFVTGYTNKHFEVPETHRAHAKILSKPYSFSDISESIQQLLSGK